MTEIIILIISILAMSPLLLEVTFYLLVRAAYALDVPDMRLSSIGFTEYLSDCAVAESMKSEEQKKAVYKSSGS